MKSKISQKAKSIAFMLRVMNFKRLPEWLAAKESIKRKKKFAPDRLRKHFITQRKTLNNRQIVTFAPKDGSTDNHIIFFHGGAYLFQASREHWNFAEKLVSKNGCKITLPDYPLAPESNYKDNFSWIEKAYDSLTEDYPEDNFILMGDSAGGGISLALMQKLNDENKPKIPQKVILISPWLDLTLSNKEMEAYQKRDVVLSMNLLKRAGDLYSAGDEPENPLMSPINGRMDFPARTIVFYGSEELFKPDCMRLETLTKEFGGKFKFVEYPQMPHDWAILPIPERDKLIDDISKFINS